MTLKGAGGINRSMYTRPNSQRNQAGKNVLEAAKRNETRNPYILPIQAQDRTAHPYPKSGS